uniref:Uncharacterized protein n=1 Tax=Arundo donax TaxID=35708 RepID=A0A0A8Z1K0_ARUDO
MWLGTWRQCYKQFVFSGI